MNHLKLSAEQARQQGRKVFYTGEPCVRGHVTTRYVCSGYCTECNTEDTRRSRHARGLRGKDVPAAWTGPANIHIETILQAQHAGRTKYYTGTPCKRGHCGPRYTCSGYCCECQAENARAARERLMGPALVPVTVRVPGNQAQALRDYEAVLREVTP